MEKYEEVKIEVIQFETEDVITQSQYDPTKNDSLTPEITD